MTDLTHALRRDEIGFLKPRIRPHQPPRADRWLKAGMLACWIVSCALAFALNLSWLP